MGPATHRSGWTAALVAGLLAIGAAVGSMTYLEEKESKSVALLTVALRGGGLRKCTGVAVGARAVLAAARCLDAMDETKYVQVQVAQDAPKASFKPRAKPNLSKVALAAPPKKRRQKLPSKEVPMETRFSRDVLRSREGGVALLRLTFPLEDAWRRAAPLAAETPPLSGYAHCRLFSWGVTSSFPPAARLGRWAARAGNWSACWQRAGAGAGAGAGGVCAVADGCLGAASGAALLCQGALVALAGPPARPADHDPCGGDALLLHPAAQDWLQKAVPDLTTAPSGLRGSAASHATTRAVEAAVAAPRRRRRRRQSKRPSRH